MRRRHHDTQLRLDFPTAARPSETPRVAPAGDATPDLPRWTFSRLVVRSRHHRRIVERLERVRHHFPELEGVTIRVGLVRKRGILGWGSLDPEQPGVWVRPRRLDLFTLAHEFTHLLQARQLVPGGERACDLHALARAPELIDHLPSYLALPDALRRIGQVTPPLQVALCGAARAALAARRDGDRRYIQRFESLVRAATERAGEPPRYEEGPPLADENIAFAT